MDEVGTKRQEVEEVRDFRQLLVWQVGLDVCDMVYRMTRDFPLEERFGLVTQMRRTAVSIPSNIAEGNSRGTTKDYIRFLQIARGSAAELETQLFIAQRQGYTLDGEPIAEQLPRCRQLLQGLIRALTPKLDAK